MFDIKGEIGKLIRGKKEKDILARIEFPTFITCQDSSGKHLQIGDVRKATYSNGTDYTCYRSSNGKTYDVYIATFNPTGDGGRMLCRDSRNIYFQVPMGAIVDDNLLSAVARKAYTIRDNDPEYDISRDVGIFAWDPKRGWYPEDRQFNEIKLNFVQPENRNNKQRLVQQEKNRKQEKIADERRRDEEMRAGDIQRFKIFQASRPENLANRTFVFEGEDLNHGKYYKGVVSSNPNWTPRDKKDVISGTEFIFNYVEEKKEGNHYTYSGYISIRPEYFLGGENPEHKYISFKSDVPLDSCTSDGKCMPQYNPNPSGAEAVLELLSQRYIYESKELELNIGELIETRDGGVKAVPRFNRAYDDPQF